MKSLQALFLITAMLAASTSRALSQNESQPIVIAKQGSFSVGGNKLLRPGTFDNHKFVGWATQAEEGQSYRGDHAYVEYQIPLHAKHLPLIFVHGYGGSGACWQTTPRRKGRLSDADASQGLWHLRNGPARTWQGFTLYGHRHCQARGR